MKTMGSMVHTTPKQRRKFSSTDRSPIDRISNLPESLVSKILSSLPTKDAVATSILSQSWRFRWHTINSFQFEHFGKKSKNQIRGAMDFVDFINMVLLSHCGESINKFFLRWNWEELPNLRPLYLNMWVNVAIAQNVRVLELDSRDNYPASRAKGKFHLPSSLYTHGFLEVLKLSGPFCVKSPNLVHLTKLAELVLVDVVYKSDESFHKLLSGCPVLESLKIVRTNERDNLVVCRVSSPVLKYLVINFGGLSVYGDLKLSIDAPALEDLYLCDHFSSHISIEPGLTSVKKVIFGHHCSDHNKLVALLQAFCSVKFLTIKWPFWGATTMRTTVFFKRLVKLDIHSVSRPQWSCMMTFLVGCIYLEELELSCYRSIEGDPWRNPFHVPICLLSSLKRFTIIGFDTGLKSEMTMLEYFLGNGLKMEKVYLSLRMNDTKRLKVLNQVSELPRASPTCKILLTSGKDSVIW